MQLGCKTFLGGVVRSLFGTGAYTGNLVQGGATLQPDSAGLLTVTGAATVAPDAATLSSVVQCDRLLLSGSGASLCASTSSKALVIIAKSSVELAGGAKMHMTGIRYPGNFGDVTLSSLIPAAILKRMKADLLAGIAFGPAQFGAGGSGGSVLNNSWRGGAGGSAGSCGGGSSGGGAAFASSGSDNDPNGGAGRAAQPYAGVPGAGWWASSGWLASGSGVYGGGLLAVLTPKFTAASGCSIVSHGQNGQIGQGYGPGTQGAGSGGGGGGRIWIGCLSGGYTNNGTIAANGGAFGTGYYASSNGVAGAVGTVTIHYF